MLYIRGFLILTFVQIFIPDNTIFLYYDNLSGLITTFIVLDVACAIYYVNVCVLRVRTPGGVLC